MIKSTKLSCSIQPTTSLDDKKVLAQLPTNLIEQLGGQEETGFHLFLNRRDIFFERGLVQYFLGQPTVHVELGHA